MKVLFVGNSHSYFNDMPRTFADLYEGLTGEKVDVTMLAYSWKDLEWHMSVEYFTVRYNILHGGYDYCIIQQAAHPFPGEETTMENAARIAELCDKVGVKKIMIQAWAEKIYPEHQELLSTANAKVAEAIGAQLAPMGPIWEKIRRVDGDIELYWQDGEHAGPYGAFSIAATLCAMISGRKASEIEETFACGDAASAGEKKPLPFRDFVQGMDLDFHHPRVLENPAEILVDPEPEKIKTILEIVDEYLKKNAGDAISRIAQGSGGRGSAWRLCRSLSG